MTPRYTRYVCLSADVAGYSGGNDHEQSLTQERLIGVLTTAAAAVGLDRRLWTVQAKGDEELALIPAGESEPLVVDDFVRELRIGLFKENLDRPLAPRLRLRLAVDVGPAATAANGFSGAAVVAVSRLVNAEPLRRALQLVPQADLVVLLSDRVYRDVVLGGHTSLRSEEFRPVQVTEKEFSERAWLRVPGADARLLDLAGPVTGPAVDQDGHADHGAATYQAGRDLHGPSQQVVQHFHDHVDAKGASFGFGAR